VAVSGTGENKDPDNVAASGTGVNKDPNNAAISGTGGDKHPENAAKFSSQLLGMTLSLTQT
jgi:hypothetical protein